MGKLSSHKLMDISIAESVVCVRTIFIIMAAKKENFLDVSKTICKIVKFFGYFHFTLALDASNRIIFNSNTSDIILFIISVFGGFLASIKSSTMSIGNSISSIIFEIGIKILIKLTLFSPTIFRVSNFMIRKCYAKIITNIHLIDRQIMVKHQLSVNHHYQWKVSIFVIVIYFCMFLLTLVIDAVLSTKYLKFPESDTIGRLLAVWNIGAYLSFTISHMLAIIAIYSRLKFLNTTFKANCSGNEEIITLSRVYLKICETMNIINKCYAINFLYYFFQVTYFGIFYLFGLWSLTIKTVDVTSAIPELAFNAISFAWFLYYFWFGAWMMIIGAWIETETIEIERYVNLYVGKCKRWNLMSLQMQHIRPIVSCGLFEINWRLLFLIIGSIFSDLIILIQFESF